MIDTGVNTDASKRLEKIDGSKLASISRMRGKRKRRRNFKNSLINSSNCRYDLVRFTATKFSIKESLENWNIYWTDLSISVQRCKEMKRFQRINHFPGMMEICRKDLLARNLNRLYKAFPEDYNVFPRTWCLPQDMADVTEYAKNHKGKCFIVKPDQGCQGRGIAITKNINQLKTYDRMICQQYIQRPFLIDGFKFDLRIYVLITSCDPMRLFVYNEGLARFATAKYKEPNVLNASNMYMHLTNYSVNKHSRTYIADDIDGSKRKLSTINTWFQKNNYDVKKIWDSIDDVIIKTMIVSLPTLKHYYHTCFPNHTTSHACFEILGFDFMFDYKLKPYILEVNHSPSFNTETTIDHEVKESLLYDTFNILNLQHNNRFRVMIEDKKRARDRLFSVAQTPEILSREKAFEERISFHRIEWENSHLGNFRKIYPSKNDEYYEKFIIAKSNTMYAETVSSKAKEAQPKVGEQSGPRRAKIPKMKMAAEVRKCEGDATRKEEVENVIKSHIEESKGVQGSTEGKSKLRTEEIQSTAPNVTSGRISLTAEPEEIDEVDERERISNMKKREFLVRSHGILEKVYENLKNAGLLKMESDIRVGRSNKWGAAEGGKPFSEGYRRLNQTMVEVLERATKKGEADGTDDGTSIDAAVVTSSEKDKKFIKNKLVQSNSKNNTSIQTPDSKPVTLREKSSWCDFEKVRNGGDFGDGSLLTEKIGRKKEEIIGKREIIRLPEKVDSGEMLGFGLGLDRPSSRAGVVRGKTPTTKSTRKEPPVRVNSDDVLPQSLLDIERPFATASPPSARPALKPRYPTRGRRFDIDDDRSVRPVVEVVTPGDRGRPTGAAQVLKIGHFGKPEVWGSLEEYFEQRKILNRNWQNTDS